MASMAAVVCLLQVSCVALRGPSTDPIDRLVDRLNDTDGRWIGGIYPIIDLPPTARAEEVLHEAIKLTGFDAGRIARYEILEVRPVRFKKMPNPYSAALVQTDHGTKILIFAPLQGNRWWTRFYEVDDIAQAQ